MMYWLRMSWATVALISSTSSAVLGKNAISTRLLVAADVEVQGEYQFERRQFGGNPETSERLVEPRYLGGFF
jgi:hypothetical protein